MKKKYTPVTEQDILDIMDSLMAKNPKLKEDLEESAKFMESISPYLKMTKEEMEKVIPDGAYNVSNGGWVCFTGKGGFINVILKVQEQLNIK